MTDQPTKVEFHYLKSPQFRTIHVDGVIGGMAPSGHLHVAVFSERIVIPQGTTFALKPDGTLGDELMNERVGREGITRELEANLVLTLPAAVALRGWLDQHLKQMAPQVVVPIQRPVPSGEG